MFSTGEKASREELQSTFFFFADIRVDVAIQGYHSKCGLSYFCSLTEADRRTWCWSSSLYRGMLRYIWHVHVSSGGIW